MAAELRRRRSQDQYCFHHHPDDDRKGGTRGEAAAGCSVRTAATFDARAGPIRRRRRSGACRDARLAGPRARHRAPHVPVFDSSERGAGGESAILAVAVRTKAPETMREAEHAPRAARAFAPEREAHSDRSRGVSDREIHRE